MPQYGATVVNNMSLRYQINLRILMLAGIVLALGGAFAIWQARASVNQEVESSIHLAIELSAMNFSKATQSALTETDWLPKFNALKQTRHLSIQLKSPAGQLIRVGNQVSHPHQMDMPPNWFVNLVQGTYPQVERPLITADGKQLMLVIQANPLDEITEAWRESIAFFGSLLLLTCLTFMAVNLVFNKSIKTIAEIVDALKTIEAGNYQQRLPAFSTQEYDQIAKAINHMTDELNAAQQKNRTLTLHSLSIQEEERQRLSQELHDELGQSLTAIKVMAVTAVRKPEGVKRTTDAIINICDHLINVVRNMMRQLHPLVLTELGLRATVEDLLNQWGERNPTLKITFNCTDAVDVLEHQYTIQIFRVIQECLTNIVRHAQATEAHIDIAIASVSTLTGMREIAIGSNVLKDRWVGDSALNAKIIPQTLLKLEIIDNGQGCTAASLIAGFGLLGMRERINSLGGELRIHAEPRQGLRINACIPLP